VARARSWFERGGREQMVQRCDVLLRAEKRRGGTPPPGPARAPRAADQAPRLVAAPAPRCESAPAAGQGEAPVKPPTLARPPPPAAPPGPAVQDGWTVAGSPFAECTAPGSPGDRELQDVLRMFDQYALADTVGPANAPSVARVERAGEAATPNDPVPAVGAPAATFDAGRVLQIAVDGEVLVRRRGLVAVQGEVELAGVSKRSRGRALEEPFGSGAAALARARGRGVLVYAADGRRYTALPVGAPGLQLREAAVFAFDAALGFENARLATAEGAEVELVRFAGEGSVLVATAGELAGLDVAGGRALRVAVGALVAWSGALAPRLVPLAESRGAADAVELSGEGRVFLDPGAPLA
jgi:uncharacterized protein (AIM24 family)